MKLRKLKRAVALFLCLCMMVPAASLSAFAAQKENVTYDKETFGQDDYYKVISQKDYVLVPGAATETEMVLNNSDGNRRQVLHIMEVDPSNPDISIIPGYYGIDKDLTDINNHKVAKLTDTVAYYRDVLDYDVVGSMNTGLAYDCNAPYSWLVYNGKVLVDHKNGINDKHSGVCQTMLCVYKNLKEDGSWDGSCRCELRTASQGLNGDEWQAIGANFGMVVNNGKLANPTVVRNGTDAARSMVGVKEDGTLVLVMNDGRGANNSKGFNDSEEGEAMLALGCQWAFNCDGGGSSTFITKRAGEDEATMRSVPCDGAERPTLNSVMIVSNTNPTGILDKIEIQSEYDYFAPGSEYTFDTLALDTKGYAMEMPEKIEWALSDPTKGSVQNGLFKAGDTTGDVEIQIKSDGKIYGRKTVHIANPTEFELTSDSTILSYSTEEKPKTVTLPIVATIGKGENQVFYDQNVIEITLSDQKAATVNGFQITATSDQSISGVQVTIKYKPTGQELTYSITYGMGSKILWDFEDQQLAGFIGQKDAEEWQIEHGISNPLNGNIQIGNLDDSAHSETFIATRENGGQVHNGNAALGVEFDFRYVGFNNWVYTILCNIVGKTVLRDAVNNNNAVKIGMWAYIPKGFYSQKGSSAWCMQLFADTNPAEDKQGTLTTDFKYNGKLISNLKEEDIPEERWIYVTADISSKDYVALFDPLLSTAMSPDFFRMYAKPTVAQKLTYYFDDITVDYSEAVDDREAPVISNATYCISDTNLDFSDAEINTNQVSFTANIADYQKSNAEGLDYATGAIYVDGVKLDNVKAAGNTLSVEAVTLSNGTHKIRFEIADKIGNCASITRQLRVNAENAAPEVFISGHNDSGQPAEAGSVYYIDIKAKQAETIDNIKTTIELQTANTWELDHMIAAKGYQASYTVNESEPEFATITIEKTGTERLSGEQTLVSIPVRVWAWDENWIVTKEFLGTSGSYTGRRTTTQTTEERFKEGEPVLKIEADVVYGEIAYADKKTGTFGNSFSVDTKLDGTKQNGLWHTHDSNLTVKNQEATCEESGYQDRTYCETCKSVVDWGKEIPAAGHQYAVKDGQLECTVCHDIYKPGTGLFEVGGKTYYAIAGKLLSGWQQVDADYYYFDPKTFTSVKTLNNGYVTYQFEADGKLKSGEWYRDNRGIKYYYGPDYYHATQADEKVVIDGNTYYFTKEGYCRTGNTYIVTSNVQDYQWYSFDENGVYLGPWKYTGFTKLNGFLYYLEDGVQPYGFVLVDGAYYYFASADHRAAVTNLERYCPVTNGLLPAGTYRFGADGKMLDQVIRVENNTMYYYKLGQIAKGGNASINGKQYAVSKDGIVQYTGVYTGDKDAKGYYENGVYSRALKNGLSKDEDGEIRYYKDEVPQHQGLVKDTDGSYYYFNSTLKAVKDTEYAIGEAETHDLLPAGTYRFGADGKMLDHVVYVDQNTMHYYVQGQIAKSGSATINGKQYTVNKDGIVQYTGIYTDAKGVKGYYTKGVYSRALKNGLVKDEDGEIRYYKDEVAQHQGLVKDEDGSYYYINSTLKAVKDTEYTISEAETHGLLPAGTYRFGADGRMLDQVIRVEKNTIYYYVLGQLAKGGNASINGKQYTVSKDGIIQYTGIYADAKGTKGYYTNGVYSRALKNGLSKDEDGEIRYYKDEEAQYQGLVQDEDGNYYYINSARKAVKNTKYAIGASKTNGLLPAGEYTFGADGRMVEPPKNGLVKDKDGEIRYYKNDVPQYQGLVQDEDGNYYYINSALKAVKNTKYMVGAAKTNGLLPAGEYTFGADGKMTTQLKNGLVKDKDGEIRYYKDGVPQYQGLVQDEDGNYYYINSALKAVKDTKYMVGAAKTNGLLPAGEYTFGADGKMTTQPKNGLVKDKDGEIRYYKDGVPQYQGLVKDTDGSYYYINSALKAVKNTKYMVGAAKTNGLLPAGEYTFGADGKMVKTN